MTVSNLHNMAAVLLNEGIHLPWGRGESEAAQHCCTADARGLKKGLDALKHAVKLLLSTYTCDIRRQGEDVRERATLPHQRSASRAGLWLGKDSPSALTAGVTHCAAVTSLAAALRGVIVT